MNQQYLPFDSSAPVPFDSPFAMNDKSLAHEYRMVSLRPLPEEQPLADCDENIAAYYRAHIATDPRYTPEVETLHVILLNTRRRVKGHILVATGTHDTILAHPLTVFRPAFIASAPAIVMVHNHPSGDPTPSEADIKITRDWERAAQLLKIALVDHVVMGRTTHHSLRALGYFASWA